MFKYSKCTVYLWVKNAISFFDFGGGKKKSDTYSEYYIMIKKFEINHNYVPRLSFVHAQYI